MICWATDVTPDSLQYIIRDLFASVILYDNKLRHADYEKVAEKQYSVTVTLDMKKLKVDSLGNERSTAINDWIELGVYAKDVHGKENLVGLKKDQDQFSTDNAETIRSTETLEDRTGSPFTLH